MYFDGDLHLDDDDQCMSCEHFKKGIACPLLEAIITGFVVLENDITVKNCGFYKPYSRHLNVIKRA
jgi:hypothetical protein